MDAESRTELGNFIALFEAHKGERLTLTPGQGRVLLMLLKKMFDDLARRLNGEWKKEDEMSDELKLCPFCGREQHLCPEEIPYTGQLHECGSCNVISYDWNTRPIEDALNARIAELEANIEILKDQQREARNILIDKKLQIDSLYEAGYKLQQRIAELEAESERFTVHSDIERQDDKWIPVSERLPDNWESVLTIDISKSTRDMVTAFYNPETSLWSTHFSCDLWVTHWMPLPEPPILYGKVCEE